MVWLAAVLFAAPVTAQVQLEDAERFVALLEQTAYRPSVTEIEREYLAPASPGLQGLLHRSHSGAVELHAAISDQRFAYRHAIELCLPAMQGMAGRVDSWLAEVTTALGLPEGEGQVEVVALFGAGASGGIVANDRIVIALEVQCRFADSPQLAEQVLEAAIRHEAVHVHQLRRQQAAARNSLLRQALIEGLADWLSFRQMGDVPPHAEARSIYGSNNEARLWQTFQKDMNGDLLGHWMYGPGRSGEPADLAYWIGSQIIAAFMDQAVLQAGSVDSSSAASAEKSALETLLLLESPESILQASAYNPVLLPKPRKAGK